MKKFTKVLVSGLCVIAMVGLSSCAVIDRIKGFFGEKDIFEGDYKAVELSAVQEIADKTADEMVKEIIFNSKGVIGRNYVLQDMTQGEESSKDERESNVKIVREDLAESSSYKAEKTRTIKDKDVLQGETTEEEERTFYYDDGTNLYTKAEEGKTKSQSGGHENLADFSDIDGGMSLSDAIEDLAGEVVSEIAWFMDTSDKTYTKIKMTAKYDLENAFGVPLTEEGNGLTFIWVLDKATNKYVAFTAEMKVSASGAIENVQVKISMAQESMLKPWDGTITPPNGLDEYVAE